MFGRVPRAERVRRVAALSLEEDRLALAVGRARGYVLEKLDFIEETPSAGLGGGTIVDAELFADALDRLAASLEQFTRNHELERIVCGVHGPFIEIQYLTRTYHLAGGGPLTEADLRDVVQETALRAADERVLLQVMPWRYLLDDYREAERPIGLRAERLTVEALGVFAEPSPFADLQDIFDDLGLSGGELALASLAAARFALTPDERHEGVVFLELAWDEMRVSLYRKRRLYLYRTSTRGLSKLAQEICLAVPGTPSEARRIIPTLRFDDPKSERVVSPARTYLRGVLEEAQRFLQEGFEAMDPPIGSVPWVMMGLLADADGAAEFASRQVGAPVRVPLPPDHLCIAGHDLSATCAVLGLLDSAASEPGFLSGGGTRRVVSRLRSVPHRLLRRLGPRVVPGTEA